MSNSSLFPLIFRYEATLQDIAPWSRVTESAYAALVNGLVQIYGLPSPNTHTIARIIQEGARRIGGLNRTRLTTDLVTLHDLVVESGILAQKSGAATLEYLHIERVLAQRRVYQSAAARWTRDAIFSGESITPTSGAAIGQINGLGILEIHPWEGIFAVPMRISATVCASKNEHLVDIEQEVQQVDTSHVRGLMTMQGYFSHTYAAVQPLSLTARIRFEQEHGGTGGDSASAAALFILLSALAEVPIRRSIAVTGALGQYGEFQPVGGINFKIEGFWELCRERRAMGEKVEGGYGIIMPASNVRDLMLRPDIAASIAKEGWFTIWLAETVDEAIPLLMGISAEELHNRVAFKLQQFKAQVQAANNPPNKK